MLVKTEGESEIGPVVSVFQDFQGIALQIDLLVEVHLGECLHGNLIPAIVFVSIFLGAEG